MDDELTLIGSELDRIGGELKEFIERNTKWIAEARASGFYDEAWLVEHENDIKAAYERMKAQYDWVCVKYNYATS